MTEFERKQLELLTQIAARLERIEARQFTWDKNGMPEVRSFHWSEAGLSIPPLSTEMVEEQTLKGPIRYRIPSGQSQGHVSTAATR